MKVKRLSEDAGLAEMQLLLGRRGVLKIVRGM
jgi:hypothetical protein